MPRIIVWKEFQNCLHIVISFDKENLYTYIHMCVCMCIYMCTHTYVYVCISVCTYIYVYVCVYMCIYN